MLSFFAAGLTFMSVELVLRRILPRDVLKDDFDHTYANAIIKRQGLKTDLSPEQQRQVAIARGAVAIWFCLSILVLIFFSR